ncbi:hypothetical protein Aduo_012700 [Ancylostoma duodenale]
MRVVSDRQRNFTMFLSSRIPRRRSCDLGGRAPLKLRDSLCVTRSSHHLCMSYDPVRYRCRHDGDALTLYSEKGVRQGTV